MLRHALRAALLPLVSYLGPAVAGILTGSLIVEQIFGIPGIGRYFVQAALNRDYTLVLGVIICYAALIIAAELLADMLYARARSAREVLDMSASGIDGDNAETGRSAPIARAAACGPTRARRLFRNRAAVASMIVLASSRCWRCSRRCCRAYAYDDDRLRRRLLRAGLVAGRGRLQRRRHALVRHRRGRTRPVRARALWRAGVAGGRDGRHPGQSLVIGVLYGATAGYLGGRVDEVMMRVVDILYSLPFIFFVIILMVIFDRNFILLFVAIGAVEWLTMARIVRGQTLSLKQKEYIEAARAGGVSRFGIITRHIIPNVVGPVVVYVTLTVPGVILAESFLSFLGLGMQEPLTSLGRADFATAPTRWRPRPGC